MEPTIQGTSSSLIRPFEWLTNAASLKFLITQAVEQQYSSSRQEEKQGESSSHEQAPKELSALHVGAGSSVVGEYMVEALGFDLVVNLDKDEETLEQMKDRWLQRCRNKSENNPELPPVSSERLAFCPNDFAEKPFPYPSNRFDLILDKSTLDCTLCSDKAAACLLVQVYRCLKVGGCYLLISFHEYDFLAPLLENLPGANWDVQHSTMERQVEDLGIINQLNADHESDRQNNTKEEEGEPATELNPSANEKPPLNVFIIRKLPSPNSSEDEDDDPHTLDWDRVSAHVHKCNDAWFQQHQPLLTRQRTQALKEAFEHPLVLQQAYLELFTDAEREHLTYEHFLEDWAAYLEQRKGTIPKKQISYDDAFLFLQEMQ
ncbi:unnamed protein product [Cylindrotheca closterium]|uniref:Methyltransferase type 11 domain-containing protein n=1 Tax=Cylindrotheca closterium TaxID=2856 RepID=A0AAD2CC86_9STRA|nr:unnamed protein product [Cylindrotheca closterium]